MNGTDGMAENGYLVPVGFPGGPYNDSAGRHGVVRVANDFFILSPEEYSVWLLCLTAAPRQNVLAEAAAYGIEGAAAVLTELEAQELVTTLTGVLAADRSAMESLRLQLLVLGLGSDSLPATSLKLGSLVHGPAVELDPLVYALALRSFTAPSMWALCENAAHELEAETELLASRLLAALPALLVSSSAFLDRVL